jgi:CheY-like chemotaxis protein
MDIHLPEMSGFETASRIRELNHYESVPIIAFSANTSELTKESVADSTMDDLLSKPLELEKLDDILRAYFVGKLNPNSIDLTYFRNAFSDNPIKLKNYLQLIVIDFQNFQDNVRVFYEAKDYYAILKELHKVEPIVSKFKFQQLLLAIKAFKQQDSFTDQVKFDNLMNNLSDFIKAVKAVDF